MRRSVHSSLFGAVLIALGVWGQAALANGFRFNDGTVQGWTLQGAFDPAIENVTFPSNFSNGWSDFYNYPQTPGSDPGGDNFGSIQLYTPGNHGIDNPGGEWWIMQFHSPDLSTSDTWQRAQGYSIRIADCMGGGYAYLFANLFVKV